MRCAAHVLVACAVAAVVAGSADAQSLQSRIDAVRDGAVTFHFAARDGVCGDGMRYVGIGHSYFGRMSDTRDRCVTGPVEVKLTIAHGEVDRVESWVGAFHQRGATDLGIVPASEAAKVLLQIGANGRGGPSAKAILPAVLADSAVVWPALLQIARDTLTRSRATRQDAMFWLSRFAGSALSGHANNLSDDDDSEHVDDVKRQAVFVLSQLPDRSGLPTLLEVARSNRDVAIRRQALFWLGQSLDPRAVELFARLLSS